MQPDNSSKIVENQGELESLCRQLRSAGTFAMDTEFVRERTFYIQLGIIQVAADGTEAVIDPLALPSLDPLFDVVTDPAVEKVVHAGEQDFAAFYERERIVPANVFDTQIAAALVGYGDQISYAKLVAKVTGVQLSKLETLTDWTARPLTRAQIDYSLEDVRYLMEVRDHLSERLEQLGRSGWEQEECRRLVAEDTYESPSPLEYYRRMKTGGLSGARLGVLREVAGWREERARARDIPRGWVLRDQSLLEIARRRPTSLKALRQIRSMKPNQIAKDADAILDAVRRGAANPIEVDAPDKPNVKAPPQADSVARLLEAWLYARSMEAEIAPSMLATRDQLKVLTSAHFRGEEPELPLLQGWRRELVGQDLLDLLEGKKALLVDQETGRVSATSTAK